MAKIAPAVALSDSDRVQLQQWVRAHFTPQQVALRSRILLLAAEGKENLEIAAALKVNRHTPALWRQRFIQEGLDAVWEIQSGRGRKPHLPPGKVAAIVDATLQTKPKGATHSWNEAPRPFVWTATVEKIMEKISRARNQLDQIKPGWARRKKRKKRK